MNAPVYMATIRRLKPGSEAEFRESLRKFFQSSLAQPGVLGVHMIAPSPGSDSREYGILRVFASEGERDKFYASAPFAEWEKRVETLSEGQVSRRTVTGLEAWFRNPEPPPRWKMALLTWVGVWPVSIVVSGLLMPFFAPIPSTFSVVNIAFNGTMAIGIVLVLTWILMPALTWLARSWLYSDMRKS